MTEHEVRRIAREAARCAVDETFTKLGVDVSGPDKLIEVQQDFAWLRTRRMLEGKIRVKLIITLITVIVVGGAAAIYAMVTGRNGL